jgi:hypothetical protein
MRSRGASRHGSHNRSTSDLCPVYPFPAPSVRARNSFEAPCDLDVRAPRWAWDGASLSGGPGSRSTDVRPVAEPIHGGLERPCCMPPGSGPAALRQVQHRPAHLDRPPERPHRPRGPGIPSPGGTPGATCRLSVEDLAHPTDLVLDTLLIPTAPPNVSKPGMEPQQKGKGGPRSSGGWNGRRWTGRVLTM